MDLDAQSFFGGQPEALGVSLKLIHLLFWRLILSRYDE